MTMKLLEARAILKSYNSSIIIKNLYFCVSQYGVNSFKVSSIIINGVTYNGRLIKHKTDDLFQYFNTINSLYLSIMYIYNIEFDGEYHHIQYALYVIK